MMKTAWLYCLYFVFGCILCYAESVQNPPVEQEGSKSGLIELVKGESMTLNFPALEGKGNRILRFQARINGISGWNSQLSIKLNDKILRYGILNRPLTFGSKLHKGRHSLHKNGLYTVFFSRDFQTIDSSIIESEQRKSGTWYVLDCGRNLKECSLKFQNKGQTTVFVQNVSMELLSLQEHEAMLEARCKLSQGDLAASLAATEKCNACKTILENAASMAEMLPLAPRSKIKLEIPVVFGGGKKLALRFQARIEGSSGWNNALKIKLNGRIVKEGILNRSPAFSAKSWKNQAMFSGNAYTVFFSPSFGSIDPSILDAEQKKESTWMLIECGEQQGKVNVEFENCISLWLLLKNITIGELPSAKGADVQGPKAEGMELVQAKRLADGIVLKQGEVCSLNIPVGEAVPGFLPVLRFRSRLAYKEVEGWGNYLNLKINGEFLTEQDKYAESRLLNRGSSFAAKGWPDQAIATGANFLVFFTNDWDRIHPTWVADEQQRVENTWFVLRLDELLKWNSSNVLEIKNVMKQANFPWNIEVKDVEFGWYRPSIQAGQHESMPDFQAVSVWKKEGTTLEIAKNGAFLIKQDRLPWMLLESSFSFPHAGDKWNGFHAGAEREYALPWSPAAKCSQENVEVQGVGKDYSVIRNTTWHNGFLEFKDTYSNPNEHPIGIIVRHKLYLSSCPKELRFGGLKTNPQFPVSNMGVPSNPTIFASWTEGACGVFAVDTVSRMQICTGGGAKNLNFGTEKLALEPNSTRTLIWRLYFLKENDYWSFINRVRLDIGANFTIPGYCQFSGLHYQRPEPDCRFVEWFVKSLGGKRPAFTISSPWFCYYDASMYSGAEQWLEVYKKAQASFDKINTWGGKLIPAFETSIQPIPKNVTMNVWPKDAENYPTDCLIVQANGKYRFTKQWTVGRPVRNYRSYVLEGSKYYKKIFAGIKGALDAGAGGVYFDIFASNSATYDRKDGATGEIDPVTFELKRQYALCGILEESTKKHLVEYIHSRGGAVVCNGFPAWESMASLPIFAFYECNDLDFATMAHGHLSTPIGLSMPWVRSEKKTGADLIQAIRGRLSNGGLFFAYITELVEGQEAAEALNHMYPITIEELHAGWIRGKERLITSVPGKYNVKSIMKPEVFLFDASGRRTEFPESLLSQVESSHWCVDLTSTTSGMLAIVENR